MKKTILTALAVLNISSLCNQVIAAEACKVSMMGRVCYEEGSQELTAAHMKGDAVAAAGNKNTELADASKAKK